MSEVIQNRAAGLGLSEFMAVIKPLDLLDSAWPLGCLPVNPLCPL